MAKRNQTNNSEEDPGRFLEIDPYSLEKEWVGQARKYYKYAIKLADARAELDDAKADFELIKAQIDANIRERPEKYGVKKLTNPAVEAAIPKQMSYQACLKALNEAKKEVSYLDAAVEALDHRKRALEKLVDLHLHAYYADPKPPKGKREEVNDMVGAAAFDRRREKK